MSEIRITCSCSTELALPASAAGKNARCPKCQAILDIPNNAPLSMPQYDNPSASAPTPQTGGPFKQDSNPYSPTVKPEVLPASRFDDNNPPPLGMMIIPLYISAGIYALLGVGLALVFGLGLMSGELDGGEAAVFIIGLVFAVVMCVGLVVLILVICSKLKQRKKWAWIGAIAFGGMYAPSAFIFLGIPILIGALNSDVQAWFNKR